MPSSAACGDLAWKESLLLSPPPPFEDFPNFKEILSSKSYCIIDLTGDPDQEAG
jgi:hypothetical protein